MDEQEVIKAIIEGKGVIVLDEKAFKEVTQLFGYSYKEVTRSKDECPYCIYGIPIIWVEGGFMGLWKRSAND